MVAPVTGPFVSEIGGSGDVSLYRYKSGYKQARPFTQPLPYTLKYGVTQSRSGTTAFDARTAGSVNWIDQLGMGNMHNIAYDRLKSKISDSANMAVNLAEASQSYAMIRARTIQLYQFGRALNRFDLLTAARILKMSAVPKRARVNNSIANNWLEYHFGWSPLIGDIHSAIDILQNPIKDQHVRASSKEELLKTHLSNPVHTRTPGAIWPNAESLDAERYIYGTKILSQGVEVAVTNPNLHLANQLGLVNPATFLYERIPFSFVLNWFFNVEQFLSQATDFYGLTLKNAWTTRVVRGTHVYTYQASGSWTDSGGKHYTSDIRFYKGSFITMVRSTGLTSPTFKARPWKVWGRERTATAYALLIQQLKGFSK